MKCGLFALTYLHSNFLLNSIAFLVMCVCECVCARVLMCHSLDFQLLSTLSKCNGTPTSTKPKNTGTEEN